MQHPLAMAELVAAVPIILAFCKWIGPGRAAPYAILGAFLLLPRYDPDEKVFGIFLFDKLTVAGASLALGVLCFDRRSLAKLRFRWVDAPILLYIAAPLAGLAFGKTGEVRGSLDQSWTTFAEWGVPYFLARIYYGDRDGPRRLSIVVVAAAVLYIPLCFYEMALGKDWFLRSLLFGFESYAQYRLGGWRPAVMLTGGLELVAWMSLATILATWLWASRERWKTRYLPAWLPPVALLLTTIACRGVYGYLTLLLGFSAIGLILLTRSRWILAPLLLVPPIYIGLRVAGIWDDRILIDLAKLFGDREAGSVGLRLAMENEFLKETADHGLLFGLGGRYAQSWADGWWLMILKRGGLLALIAHYATFLLPPVLFLFRRSSRPVIASAAAGLALFLILQMIDSLHNTPLIAVATLFGGSLTGMFLGESGLARSQVENRRRPASSVEDGHATYRLGDIINAKQAERSTGPTKPVERPAGPTKPAERPTTSEGVVCFLLSVACLLYVFGHARVDGQEAAKFVGGLGSALLFAAVGAIVAGSPRRSLARVAAFGLFFGALGITFNLGLHASSRPFWSADILQGMAISGVIVAGWRRLTGGGSWAYALLAALAATWWVFEPFVRPFPGSQYLFEAGSGSLSLFPVLPWLTLSALGAWLMKTSMAGRVGAALVLGSLAAMGWSLGAVKFPLNPIYAMAGGSLASAVFVLANQALRWSWVRIASEWLGRRWMIFFYVHLSIVPVLVRFGLVQPLIGWTVLACVSIAATWLISAVMSRLRRPFHWPATWVILLVATLAVGFWPGLPGGLTVVLAGGIGLLFAARDEDLATLILGPQMDDPPKFEGAAWLGYATKITLVAGGLVAPELISKLPGPFGLAPRPAVRASTTVDEASGSVSPIPETASPAPHSGGTPIP